MSAFLDRLKNNGSNAAMAAASAQSEGSQDNENSEDSDSPTDDTSAGEDLGATISTTPQQPVVEAASFPKGTYKAVHLKRAIRANGTIFRPNADGLFVPTSDEDKELMEYYAQDPMMVVAGTGK